jgi:DNA-binding beta-propeller fold protein YncE
MKPMYKVLLLAVLPIAGCRGQNEFGQQHLQLKQTIVLPGVKGRIDHLAYNDSLQQVYVAALGNNTVEVADLRQGRVSHSITGLHEPQGVEHLSTSRSIIVANGGNGICAFFDALTIQEQGKIEYNNDADDVRYVQGVHRAYVGYGDGGIGIIDELSKKEIGRITFKGHPEGFQVDPSTQKIWVNVPDGHRILVLDGNALKVIGQWTIKEAAANFPMAYDSVHHRLFIGCRSPARLIIFDSETGKQIAAFPCTGDTDDVFYDAPSKSILVSGGSGSVDVFQEKSENNYTQLTHMNTRKGARTSLWIPQTKQWIIAAPANNGQAAALFNYTLTP